MKRTERLVYRLEPGPLHKNNWHPAVVMGAGHLGPVRWPVFHQMEDVIIGSVGGMVLPSTGTQEGTQ